MPLPVSIPPVRVSVLVQVPYELVAQLLRPRPLVLVPVTVLLSRPSLLLAVRLGLGAGALLVMIPMANAVAPAELVIDRMAMATPLEVPEELKLSSLHLLVVSLWAVELLPLLVMAVAMIRLVALSVLLIPHLVPVGRVAMVTERTAFVVGRLGLGRSLLNVPRVLARVPVVVLILVRDRLELRKARPVAPVVVSVLLNVP